VLVLDEKTSFEKLVSLIPNSKLAFLAATLAGRWRARGGTNPSKKVEGATTATATATIITPETSTADVALSAFNTPSYLHVAKTIVKII